MEIMSNTKIFEEGLQIEECNFQKIELIQNKLNQYKSQMLN